jgi:hypothetical protein
LRPAIDHQGEGPHWREEKRSRPPQLRIAFLLLKLKVTFSWRNSLPRNLEGVRNDRLIFPGSGVEDHDKDHTL